MLRRPLAAFCLVAAACAGDDTPSRELESSCEITHRLTLPGRTSLDLVFVVDRSTAMAPYAERLAASGRRFDALLDDLGDGRPSLHVGVLAADVADGTFRCQGDRRATFDCLATLGTTAGAPAPLASLEAALAANPTFRRPNAWLHVVILSAADDTSPDDPRAYADRLRASVGIPALSVAAVVDPAAAPRLAAFVDAAARPTLVPIADDDWIAAFPFVLDLARESFGTFCLAPEIAAAEPRCSATLSEAATGVERILPRCAASGPRPCWAVRPISPDRCPGPDPREIVLERDEISTSSVSFELRCAAACD